MEGEAVTKECFLLIKVLTRYSNPILDHLYSTGRMHSTIVTIHRRAAIRLEFLRAKIETALDEGYLVCMAANRHISQHPNTTYTISGTFKQM
jgi:hypothetical protein